MAHYASLLATQTQWLPTNSVLIFNSHGTSKDNFPISKDTFLISKDKDNFVAITIIIITIIRIIFVAITIIITLSPFITIITLLLSLLLLPHYCYHYYYNFWGLLSLSSITIGLESQVYNFDNMKFTHTINFYKVNLNISKNIVVQGEKSETRSLSGHLHLL